MAMNASPVAVRKRLRRVLDNSGDQEVLWVGIRVLFGPELEDYQNLSISALFDQGNPNQETDLRAELAAQLSARIMSDQWEPLPAK